MNSFEELILTGANASRYAPILGNATGIIGAYRKVAVSIGIGQTPLFLLDGILFKNMLNRAVERLSLTVFVAIYRPFNAKIKRRAETTYMNCRAAGFIKRDGSVAEWVREDIYRFKSTNDTFVKEHLQGALRPYLDYEKAWEEYTAAISVYPIDMATGQEITGDLNEYLYNRAKAMFPLGIESVLEVNKKQSAIHKSRYFVDGLENAPAPKNVRQSGQGLRTNLPYIGQSSIDDTIEALRDFSERRIYQGGAVRLTEIITYCAEIGLYKGNITLYIMGAALRSFIKESAIFYNGMAYWRYSVEPDIASWILRVYDILQLRLINGKLKYLQRYESASAIFFDETGLKQRIECIFGVEPTQDTCFDTLGASIIRIGKWITENLRYPIAFLDSMLHHLFMERSLYGEKLQQYNAYFTVERCSWLRSQLPHADALARQAIKEAVGSDPDKTDHVMSRLPKGHYAPVLYSTEDYIEEILRKPRIAL